MAPHDLYSGTDGKAIHLVATADIADLSLYGLQIGGGRWCRIYFSSNVLLLVTTF